MQPSSLIPWRQSKLPAVVEQAGFAAQQRFVEFFTAELRNRNTRGAYAGAVRLFLDWCEQMGCRLDQLTPVIVASYVERLERECGYAKPTVKQHLAAIRMMLNYLVTGGVLAQNASTAVRGPRYRIRRGKTSVLTAEQAGELISKIETHTVAGLRDRALIAVMVYSFARVSAVLGMKVADYFPAGKRWKFRFLEKGGRHHELYAHHKAEAYVDEYLQAAGIRHQTLTPLFRSLDRKGNLSPRAMGRVDALRMVKRRAVAAGLAENVCNHTFRATGITAYLKNGGRLEVAQQMAGHESARTTGLYDRREDEVALEEIERIRI